MLDELPAFDHVDATSIAEAVSALAEHGARAQVLAGGTDLLGLMKDRISGPGMPVPDVLVNVKRIPELAGITELPDGGLRIGAATTLVDVERDPRVASRFPALAQAAGAVATAQIRAMGTVGGNLCQRPWCWYFRHPQFPCLKRGGRQCFALPGNNRTYFSVLGLGVCVMSHPSDLAPALMALDARVTVAGPAGRRAVPIDQFFRGPAEPHRDGAGAGRDHRRGGGARRRRRARAASSSSTGYGARGTSRSPRSRCRPPRGPGAGPASASRWAAWLRSLSRHRGGGGAGRPGAHRVPRTRGGRGRARRGRDRSPRTATRSI